MGFLDNYKITSTEIAQNKVQSAPDTLTGTAQDNKKVFDNLAELVANKVNAVIEKIGSDLNDDKNLMQSTDYAVTDSALKTLFGSTSTLKSILQFLGNKKGRWGTKQTVSLPFTVPSDGIFTVVGASNGSSAAIYLSEDNNILGAFQATTGARGSACFPVSSGQSIKVFYSTNVTDLIYTFTPFA